MNDCKVIPYPVFFYEVSGMSYFCDTHKQWCGVRGCGLTPLALDGAIAPDNQQVLPADVLDGDGVLPEPPRQ